MITTRVKTFFAETSFYADRVSPGMSARVSEARVVPLMLYLYPGRAVSMGISTHRCSRYSRLPHPVPHALSEAHQGTPFKGVYPFGEIRTGVLEAMVRTRHHLGQNKPDVEMAASEQENEMQIINSILQDNITVALFVNLKHQIRYRNHIASKWCCLSPGAPTRVERKETWASREISLC
jgi:hypothetical protein